VDLSKSADGEVIFEEEHLKKVSGPLLRALEIYPAFFVKYAFLIQNMESVELIAVVLFKTLLDKPHYYQTSRWVAVRREDVARDYGEDILVQHECILTQLKALFENTGTMCTHVRWFIAEEFIPKEYFDSESLIVALQLIVDEKVDPLSTAV
jgi:hypothetical protein